MTDEPVKVRVKFHLATGRTGHKEVRKGEAPEPPPVSDGHTPRIAQLMALAIRFEQLIRDGVARDQADLARLALVSRARVTQIMDLLMLAPDIQESPLFLPPVHRGRDPIPDNRARHAFACQGLCLVPPASGMGSSIFFPLNISTGLPRLPTP